MKSLTEQFADWVRTKPAEEAYNYCSPFNCAFAQFLRESGMAKEPGVDDHDWIDFALPRAEQLPHLLPAGIDRAVNPIGDDPALFTFGALAERLSSSPALPFSL